MNNKELAELHENINRAFDRLRLGKLDVHVRCAPFEPEWNT